MKIKNYLLLLLVSLTFQNTFAQKIETYFNTHAFVDNREYAKSGRVSQTIFGARFAPELGFLIDSTHRIRVGVNYLKEFGSTHFSDKIDPIIYYQYQDKKHEFFIGAFPRLGLIDKYPRALLADTLNYFRPNLEGMFYQYQKNNFRQNIWIDWTGKQTETNRETFLFGFSGKFSAGKFFISNDAYMYHNALSANSPPNQHLEDNGAVQVQLGLDFSKQTFLDSLSISAGPAVSIERVRNVSDLNTPMGLITYLHLGYKKVSLTNTFYAGEGHQLINGDAFYKSKQYDRLDIGWKPIQFKNIEGGFTFSLHFVDGIIDSQQAFSLRYALGNLKR